MRNKGCGREIIRSKKILDDKEKKIFKIIKSNIFSLISFKLILILYHR